MGLKSYRLRGTLKKSKKKKSRPSFVRGATGAIIGVALVSQVASAFRRI